MQLSKGLVSPGIAIQLQRAIGNRALARWLDAKPQASKRHTLPKDIRRKMERSFQADFSQVKLQEGQPAGALGARAYAQGDSVHFAPGQYDPHSRQGENLLGHELAHVLQQRRGQVKPTGAIGGATLNDDPRLEAEADALGEKAASESAASTPSREANTQVQSAPTRPAPVIQGKFVTKVFTTYVEITELEDLLEQVRDKDADKVGETTALYNEAEKYYDWDKWLDGWQKQEVSSDKIAPLKVEKRDFEVKEEAQALVAPLTYLPESMPDYVSDEPQQKIRTLGEKAGYKHVQLVFHALGAEGRRSSLQPEARLDKLAAAVHQASAARKDLGSKADSTLTVFVAPEGYFSYLQAKQDKPTLRHQYNRKEFEQTVAGIQALSSKAPGVLIVPGSIMWYEAAQEPPEYLSLPKYSPKQIEYTYNTSPVAYEGQVFLYNKHVDTGGDIDPGRGNQKMAMDVITHSGKEVGPNTVGYFSVGGLRIGLEICGDSGAGVLNTGLQALFKKEKPRVDVQVLIAAGQSPSQEGYVSDGWVINADQIGSTSFSAYKIQDGKIDSGKDVLEAKHQKMPDDADRLVVAQQLLDSIGEKDI